MTFYIADDNSPLGQFIIAQNLGRQYDFLNTAFVVINENVGFHVSESFIKDINFYGVQFVSQYPGEFRHDVKEDVYIDGSEHKVPEFQDVPRYLQEFMTKLKDGIQSSEPTELAAYVLWRLNWIHPFVQGNGRTARALSYFLLCYKLGQWLPGQNIIPEQIRANPERYYELLNEADRTAKERGDGSTDLAPFIDYIEGLLDVQIP